MTVLKTQRQIAEELSAMVQGGEYSPDNPINIQEVEYMLPSLRAAAIMQLYGSVNGSRKFRSINDANYQTIKTKKISSDQPSTDYVDYCYSVFSSYPVISLTATMDTFSYVHGINHTQKYSRVPNGFEGFQQQISKGVHSYVRKFFAKENNNIYLSDKSVGIIVQRAVWADPSELMTYDLNTSSYVSAYDPDTDPYPVSGDVYALMTELFKQRMNIAIQTPADKKDDGIHLKSGGKP